MLLTLLCAGTPLHALEPSFIEGTIFDTLNSSVITNATITTTTGLPAATVSGSFSLRVPPDVYTIIVSAWGYRSNMVAGIVSVPGQTVRVNVGLTPASSETVKLQGRVVDFASGEGLKHAIITTDLGGLAISSDSGFFDMITPSGFAQVTAAAEGYISDTTSDMFISPLRTKQTVIFLQPSSGGVTSVSGSVRNTCTQTRLSQAVVATPSGIISVAENGMYALEVSDSLTTLFATADGYQFAYRSFTPRNIFQNTTVDFELVPTLNGSAALHGTVADSITGEVLDDVRMESNTGAITLSGDNGTFKLYTSTCTTSLHASKSGYADKTIQVAQPFAASDGMSIELDPLAVITGTIFDANDNHTIRHVIVSIEGVPSSTTASGDDGSYELSNIFPGRYTLTFSHDCYRQASADVTVGIGELAEFDVHMPPTALGTLQGTVRNSITGEPVKALIVADHGSLVSGGPAGTFQAEMPACPTDITVSATGYLTKTIRNIMIDAQAVTELSIELVPCPIIEALRCCGIDRPDAVSSALRRFRDQVLLKDHFFAVQVRAFYRNAGEIALIMASQPDLQSHFVRLLQKLYTMITCGMTADTLCADKELTDDLGRFLEQFSRHAGPALQKHVLMLKHYVLDDGIAKTTDRLLLQDNAWNHR